jgi:hypothetical protein
MRIVFPNVPPSPTTLDTLAFPALVDEKQAICEIPSEALQDHCGATTNQTADLVAAFKAHRFTIEAVARRMYNPASSRWLLSSKDF